MNKKITLFLIFFTAINIFAVTNYVSKTGGHISPFDSWANAATNIQDAVDVAIAGDIVLVNDGTYYPADQIMVTNAIAVKSVNGAEKTIVDAGFPTQTNRCFYLNNANPTIDGFTITNGYANNGGGIYCYSGSKIENCIISRNKASNSGGGVFCYSGGKIKNCIINGNEANVYGGGIRSQSESTVQDCTINRNKARIGGGVYCSHNDTIQNCTISRNKASLEGGGICFSDGGIARNCTISGNEAATYGGGVACKYGGTVRNCTISGNISCEEGGGVFCTDDEIIIQNCIIYYNYSHAFSNYKISGINTFEYNCTTPWNFGTGNITNAPILLDSAHIANNSPCVNAGNFNYATGVDIDGDFWLNPPAIGCDQPSSGSYTGKLNVALFAKYDKIATGHPNYFSGYILGHATSNTLSFDNGDVRYNMPGGDYSWDTTGTYKVILTAFNNTYPAGISATVTVEVVEKQIRYVSKTGEHIFPFDSWAKAATNIQAAVNAATSGDTVLVNDGTYYPADQIMVTNAIAVKSVNGAEKTIVDAGFPTQTNRCFYLNNANPTIDGFTITNGYANIGGGIYCDKGGTVQNCIIINNKARSGGGVCCNSGGTITNCIISGNKAYEYDGGGIYCSSGTTVQNCIINENSAMNNGGGVNLSGGDSIQNCTISGNDALYIGGGVYCSSGSTVQNCIICSNKSDTSCAGVYCASGGIVQNCTISENISDYFGGGVHCSGGTVLNCAISRNSASDYGGGVYCSSGGTVQNCTISGNSASNYSGGVYCASGGTVQNCTISGNSASNYSGGVYCDSGGTVQNCIIYYNYALSFPDYRINDDSIFEYNCSSPLQIGIGNITNEPMLLDSAHIANNSPCVNAGNFNYATGVDIDGDFWLNPPAIGCDQPSSGSYTGKLNVVLFAKYDKIATGYPNYFYGCINGITSNNTLSFDNGNIWHNKLGGYYSWNTPGTYKVILTAFNSTYPAGISATVTVEVIENQTRYVSKTGAHIFPFDSWANAATNIQAAVDVALIPGSTVLINDGTYYIENEIIITKDIIVKSVNGAKKTIIDGNFPAHTNRCFYLNIANPIIDGLTITNGYTKYGGGIYCDMGGTVQNCLIIGNHASYGSGVYFSKNGLVQNCTINENEASEVGSMFCCEGGTIQNCVISGNKASRYGGGVCCIHGGIVLNCTITGNEADFHGGGVYCDSGDTVQNCRITRNEAHDGGGVYCIRGGIVLNCRITRNEARDGGGVYCSSGSTIQNCMISENKAFHYGGGGYCHDGGKIKNCTINMNEAEVNSGGLYCDWGGTVQSCTIIGNFAPDYGGVVSEYTVTFQNCIIWNNINGNNFYLYTTNIYNCIENWTDLSNGIITNNPRFVSTNDFHLQSDSPCINTGTNMSWMWTATDLDGNPRITEGTVDMGAYEYLPEPCLFIIYIILFGFVFAKKFSPSPPG